MDHLRCVVQRITYANELSGYTVLKCSAKGYQDLSSAASASAEAPGENFAQANSPRDHRLAASAATSDSSRYVSTYRYELVTVVGTMPETHVGSVLTLEGFWKVDGKDDCPADAGQSSSIWC